MVWMKKSAGKSTGLHTYTKQDMRHVGWCLKNSISIAVSPDWRGVASDWLIEIKIRNNVHVDPVKYKKNEVMKKMYKYYKYYYDKHNKQ